MTRTMGSEYMTWAKSNQRARYTLALSGIEPVSFEELGARLEDLALSGSDTYGWMPLREAIGALHGVGAAGVVTAAGTSGANHLAMSALLAPGDEVVVEDPVYEPVAALAAHLGATVRTVRRAHENGFGLDPADLARAVTPLTALVLLTNLHNPSSAMIDAATLREVAAIAEARGVLVISDEVYLDAAFEKAAPTATTLGPRFIVTSSLTKVCGLGGLRGGWIAADPLIAEKIWAVKNLFGVDEAHVAERLTLVGLRERPRLLARARGILDANRTVWNAFLAARAHDLDVAPSELGTTSFPRLRHGDGDLLERHLRAAYDTSIVPGSFFGAPGHVRIGFTVKPEIFREGIERLGRALDDVRDGRVSSAR